MSGLYSSIMSEDKDKKISHTIYISAGMAAAGMGVPRSDSKKKDELSEEKNEEVEELEESQANDEAPTEDAEETETETETVPETDLEIGEDEPQEFTDPFDEPDPAAEKLEEESYIADETLEADEPEVNDSEEGDPEEEQSETEEPETEEPETEEPEANELEVEEPESPPEELRKIAVLGRESEDDLKEIFSRMGSIEVTTPGEFDDFYEFIEKEKPEFVVVATPGNGDHHELIKAALESGAHVFSTTPFTRTLKEADALVAIAESKALTLSVGNALACHPTVLAAFNNREKLIGDLLEMRVYGEMDAHSGGEDLLVNGALLFDVARMFGGEAEWCCAEVNQRGERAMGDNIFHSREANLGQLLGDQIHARFGMDSGVYVNFISDPRAKQISGPGGIEFVGTKSIMRLHVSGESPPTLSVLQNSAPNETSREDKWRERDGADEPVGSSPLEDWLAAADSSSEPACSGLSALKSLEMVHAVWQAGLTARRAYFPLVNRLHPLNEELL